MQNYNTVEKQYNEDGTIFKIMAYIGKTPVIGNFQVCDAISV
jgi:hypothetical protein